MRCQCVCHRHNNDSNLTYSSFIIYSLKSSQGIKICFGYNTGANGHRRANPTSGRWVLLMYRYLCTLNHTPHLRTCTFKSVMCCAIHYLEASCTHTQNWLSCVCVGSLFETSTCLKQVVSRHFVSASLHLCHQLSVATDSV